jgi:hypothetical protein
MIRWLAIASFGAASWLPGREALSLNGTWEQVVTADRDLPAPDATWEDTEIPSTVFGNASKGTRYAWYRRSVTVPDAWQGQRVFLKLWGARYAPAVFVDGKQVAERLGGWTPFEVELTTVQPGATVQIAVRCQDWSATFAAGAQVPEGTTGDLRRSPAMKGKIEAPIGGHWSRLGLWDEVELLARPRAYLDDVAIDTSVRRHTLTVRGKLSGLLAGATVSGTVLDDGKAVLTLPPAKVDAEGHWRLRVPFGQDIQLWSDAHPKLYQLRLELSADNRAADVWQQRFGFRELWREGFDFYFNGVKRHLLASSGWPVTGNQTADEVREGIRRLAAANVHVFRLHTQPWQHKWLDVADEEGLLLVEEGALWCDGAGLYDYRGEALWRNIKKHLAGMVRRDRNHPSLVMWSIENELLHCGASRHDPKAEEKLADVGVAVKALDPTHLITYEADIDPGGAADVIGLHYPHEMPRYTDYPNTADWLDQTVVTGTEGGIQGSRHKEFRWAKDKPLYIGEFLWVPSGSFAPGTVFYGDEAYLDRRGYNVRAKADSWVYQTVAYRRAGVSGMCPWTFAGTGGTPDLKSPLYPAQTYVYEPVSLYPREPDSRFFSGQQLVRHFDVFNDSPEPLDLQLKGTFGPQSVASSVFRLPPAGYRSVALSVSLPEVMAETPLACRVALLANGTERHVWEGTIRVFPANPVRLPTKARVVWYEPAGALAIPVDGDRLRKPTEIAALDPSRDVLVVAPKAFRQPAAAEDDTAVIGQPTTGPSEPLLAFLAKGGRVLVLAQETLSGLPFGVSLVDHPSTFTFPITVNPVLLRGIARDDLRFWAGDNYVTRREVARPTGNGGRTLLVSGGDRELAQGPLAEVRVGPGRVLLCQALVGGKFATEPMARRLLGNCLDYLAEQPVAASRPVAVHAPDAFCQQLAALGVATVRVTGAGDLRPGMDRLILAGRPDSAVVERFLKQGGKKVYWHAPDPESFAALGPRLGAKSLEIVPGAGPLRMPGTAPQWLDGLSREELYFVGTGSVNWRSPVSPDPTIIDSIVLPRQGAGGTRRRFEAEDMATEIKIERPNKNPPGVWFHTNGRAITTVHVAKAGLYRLDVIAGSMPAGGVHPHARLRANGKVVGAVQLTQKRVKAYPALVQLPAGEVELTVEYTNDSQVGGEDRNLMLDAIELGTTPIDATAAAMPVMPPALVRMEGPVELTVDTIRWDQASSANRSRAQRLASVLMANFGASFRTPGPEPEWVLPRHFEPVGTIPYFRKTASQINLVAPGTVEASFQCARSGRYEVVVRGFSKPAANEYAKARVSVDGRDVGEVEIASPVSESFVLGTVQIEKGTHRLTVAYTNDLYKDGQDRNLYLNAVGFRP